MSINVVCIQKRKKAKKKKSKKIGKYEFDRTVTSSSGVDTDGDVKLSSKRKVDENADVDSDDIGRTCLNKVKKHYEAVSDPVILNLSPESAQDKLDIVGGEISEYVKRLVHSEQSIVFFLFILCLD